MQTVLEQVRTVAPTRATVLLTGETGVGKGVIARLIHHWSNRGGEPFVGLHCGAIPDTLLESELFGHERGSFTGAHRRKKGKFELGHKGTLFLDEVGTITPAAQIKLLDVVQRQRFQRVGGEEEIDVDVRIVAASNRDLEEMHKRGEFRADLYFRLSVFPIEIPPLRQRGADLSRLVGQILESFSRRYQKRIEGLDPAVEQAFRAYEWPGNIRELENVLERACILETTARISPARIPLEILESAEGQDVVPVLLEPAGTLAAVRGAAVAATERRYLERLLAAQNGRMDASANAAGITTRQLRKLLARHGIDKADYKRARAEPKPGPQPGESAGADP